MQKAIVGIIVAGALALSASTATFFGVAAWKVVLALAGAVLYVSGSDRLRRPRDNRRSSRPRS